MRHPFGSRRARRVPATVALAGALVVCLATAAVASFADTDSVGGNAFSTRILQPPSALSLTPTCSGGVAGVDAAWTASPSGYASGYRLQRWKGGVLDGEQTVGGVGTESASDSPLTSGVTYEFRLITEFENWTSPPATAAATAVCEQRGTVLWRTNGDDTPQASTWDGATWPPPAPTAPVGEWHFAHGASASTRDEVAVIGLDRDSDVSVMMRTNGTWADAFGGPLSTSTNQGWSGVDVAYESSSDDAVIVWNNGTNGTAGLSYRVWNGVSWTAEATITAPLPGEPEQMHLAASPVSDEMVLVVSNATSQDYAFVWNGSTWGSAITLDAGSGNHQTDVNVAYESQRGRALVAYAEGGGAPGTDVRYRFWNGTSWSAQGSLAVPGGLTGANDTPRWLVLGSDPSSNRIAMGVVTEGSDTWLAVWSGSAWANLSVATTASSATDAATVAVAFEGTSGQALAVYGVAGPNEVRARTWAAGSGWSPAATLLATGKKPNTMTLATDRTSDRVGVLVQDDTHALTTAIWDGAAWTALTELEADTGETKFQPFTWVWE